MTSPPPAYAPITPPTPIFLNRPLTWWLVVGVALLYGVYFSIYTVQRHNAFLTSAYDLGNFDQAIWNTSQGRPFAMSNLPDVTIRFAHHVEPILLLIAPLYWIWSDVRLLLILQSVAIGLSAIPLYDYAKGRIGAGAAVLVAVAYLMVPALQGVNLFDFHAVALAPLFLLPAWRYLNEQKNLPFAIAAILAAATKEEISLLIAMMGLYALVIQRRHFGWFPFLLGVGWFLFVLEVISPAFNQAGNHEFLGYYSQWGDSALDVAGYLLTHPLEVIAWFAADPRRTYLIQLLLPTIGLALFAPQVLLIAAPSLAVNLLSTYAPMSDLVGYHYPAPIVPFVMVAGVAGLATLVQRVTPNERTRHWLYTGGAVAMVMVTVGMQRAEGATPFAEGWHFPQVTPHHQIGQSLLATIPSTASVSAQSPINPHLSQREQIFRYPDGQETADYLLFDVTVPDLFVHPNDLKADIEGKLESGMWGIAQAQDGWLILQRCGADTTCIQDIPNSFYSYVRPTTPQPQFAADIRYGDALRLIGYDLVAQGKTTQARFYWEVLRPISEPVRPFPLYFDRTWSTVLEDTNLRPLMEMVWYPPQAWQVGEIVQTTTLPYSVGTDYNLVMAVLEDGTQPEGARLPVTIGVGDALPEIAKENAPTLLRMRENQIVPATLRQFELPDGVSTRTEQVGDRIRLAGATVQSEGKAGYTLEVTLYWQATTPLPADYTAFVQLVNADGSAAQNDQFPTTRLLDGTIPRPTSGWANGEVVADNHIITLPPEMPPGDYEVIVGMYDLANNATRLPVTANGNRLPDDVIRLGTVGIGAP
jgi:uncharacterized membrane protein